MKLEPIKLWSNAVTIKKISEDEFKSIQQWCADNCKGQWNVISANAHSYPSRNLTTIISSSPPKFSSDVDNHPYSPASFTKKFSLLIAFEEEDDLVTFKLNFHSSEDD